MAINDDLAEPILHSVDPNEDNELDEQPTGCGASACCNPRSSVHRFIALVFMCLVGFGKLGIAICLLFFYHLFCKNKKIDLGHKNKMLHYLNVIYY